MKITPVSPKAKRIFRYLMYFGIILIALQLTSIIPIDFAVYSLMAGFLLIVVGFSGYFDVVFRSFYSSSRPPIKRNLKQSEIVDLIIVVVSIILLLWIFSMNR